MVELDVGVDVGSLVVSLGEGGVDAVFDVGSLVVSLGEDGDYAILFLLSIQ